MADLCILEFSAPEAVQIYTRVNKALGIDPSTHTGDWPRGLLSHEAGGEGDSLVVVESWESHAAQEEFMNTRLGPAFGQADAPQPTRVTWLPQVGGWHRD
ncbi:MAG TPA: hypothetical protein VGN47_09725 [Blastococcus sp.]|jgi:hypothetical protein|nr:hypothetical protein [Blastococcus sp.]